MMTTIFYGAGKNASFNFSKWLSLGLQPVCFVDIDDTRHHTFFYSDDYKPLEIISIIEAITKYPDYELYLTQIPESLAEITSSLRGIGIPEDRIKYCEKQNLLSPRHCENLESNYFVIDGNPPYFSYCCRGHRRFSYSSGDFAKDYDFNTRRIQSLKQRLKLGLYTSCDGCIDLKQGNPRDEGKRKMFNFSTGLYGGHTCNFKCTYCTYENLLFTPPNTNKLDVLEVLTYISKTFKAEEIEIIYACGEISVSKYRDKILNLWLSNKWAGLIVTNSSIYCEQIAELLSNGVISVNTSLDSGTPETFKKVKGVDCFDKVVGNIRRYAETGGAIQLKYILLNGINDKIEDVDGFVNIAREVGAKVILASDSKFLGRTISEQEKQAAYHLVRTCKENDIVCSVDGYFYSDSIYELRDEIL